MLFNATFKNISDISWLSVLLVEETGVATENDKPVAHLPIWIGVWRLMSLSIIFQSYCAVSFIGDGNRSTRRKPPTCHTSTLQQFTLIVTVIPFYNENIYDYV
jgi:hypothetical protein